MSSAGVPFISRVPFISAPSTTLLSKRRSLGLSRFGHNCLGVFVQEMEGLLTVLGVAIVACGEIILEIHLQIPVLGTTLSQEGIRDVTLLGVLTDGLLFRGTQSLESLSVKLHSHILQ